MGTTYQDFTAGLKEFKKFQKANSACFNENCDQIGIASHSLSKSKILQRLKGKVNSKEGVYSLDDDIDFDRSRKIVSTRKKTREELPFIGIGEASTFYGFCKCCDNELFDTIDNSKFDDTHKSAFLHAYRTYAHFISQWLNQEDYLLTPALKQLDSLQPMIGGLVKKLHAEIESVLQNQKIDEEITYLQFQESIKPFLDKISGSHIGQIKDQEQLYLDLLGDLNDATTFPLTVTQFKLRLKQFTDSLLLYVDHLLSATTTLKSGLNFRDEILLAWKKEFQSNHAAKTYSKINSWSFPFNYSLPFAGSFLFNINGASICMTILPDESTSVVLFSTLESPTRFGHFFSQLNVLEQPELELALSELLISHGYNVYFKPNFWNNLDARTQKAVIDKTPKGTQINLFKAR